MSAAVLQTYPLPADPDLPPRSYGRSPIVAGMAKTFELHVSGCFPRASSSRMRALAAASSFRSASIVAAAACHEHGSWLDLAEFELGVLSSQCLDRRIPDKQTLVEEIAAWEHDRNANHTKSNWHFTTPNARIKLQHLYPSI